MVAYRFKENPRKKPYYPIGNMALMDMYLFFIMIFARIDNQILIAIHVIY